MKFADIKKFTGDGNYYITVPLFYLRKSIQAYADDYILDLDPPFQRAHVWTKEQSIAYIEYLLRGGVSARDFYFNCAGWNSSNTSDVIVIVDGKQRLNALLEFLNNEMPVFGVFYRDYEDELRMSTDHVTFHINDLETTREVLIWYLEMNTGGVVHTKKELDKVRRMLEEEQGNE